MLLLVGLRVSGISTERFKMKRLQNQMSWITHKTHPGPLGKTMYLLDSNICIDFMRGKLPYGYQVFRSSDPRLFGIPAVVEAELYLGAAKSSFPEDNKRIVEHFLLPFETVAFSSECARATHSCLSGKEGYAHWP